MGFDLNLIIQLILIVSLSIIAILILRLYKRIQKEKRITKFSISSINNKSDSFFDNIRKSIYSFISYISNIFNKSNLLVKYANKYDKYVELNDKFRDNSMKFIVNKLLIAFVAVFITIISDVLRLKQISILQLLFAFVLGYLVLDLILALERKQREMKKEEDLLKAIIIMDNAFKSGKSIMQAIELVAEELDGFMGYEFKKMFIDMNYGLDVETVFNRFALRMGTDEAKYMASGLSILNKTGGNIVNIFDALQKGFFDRKKLREELKSITAVANFIYKFLCVLPIALVSIICLWNPEYFNTFYTTVSGKILLVVILIIYLVYIIVIRKINRLED